MKLTKLGVQTRLFDGMARVIAFPNFDVSTLSSETTLADIFKTGGKDIGQIVEETPAWEGDEMEINTLKNTEGGVIRSVTTPGTLAWSCRIPHSVETAEIVGGTKMDSAELGGGFTAADGKPIIGINPGDLNHQWPIGVLNLVKNEFAFFPKASVGFSLTIEDDGLMEYNTKATAEEIDTDNLQTMMFIPLAGNPFEYDPDEKPEEGDEEGVNEEPAGPGSDEDEDAGI